MTTTQIPSILPVIALPLNQILYPSVILSLQLNRLDSIHLIRNLIKENEDSPGNGPLIIACNPLTPSTTSPSSPPTQSEIHPFGTAARIIRLERLPTSNGFLAVVEGLTRIHLDSFISATGTRPGTSYNEANISILPSIPLSDNNPDETRELLSSLQQLSSSLLTNLDLSGNKFPPLVSRRLKAFVRGLQPTTCGILIDVLFGHLPSSTSLPTQVTFEDRLSILEASNLDERVKLAVELLSKANESLGLQKRIGEKVDENVSRRQREYLLLQQLAAIRSELEDLAKKDPKSPLNRVIKGGGGPGKSGVDGEEEEEEEDEISELEKAVKAKNWSEESGKVARKELKRLKKSPPQGAEHGVIRNYLETLLAIPWNESTPLPNSVNFIEEARIKLDKDHYGLEKIKRRLLEWLAVLRLREQQWKEEEAEEKAKEKDSLPPPLVPEDKRLTAPSTPSPSPTSEATSTAVVPYVPPTPSPTKSLTLKPRPKAKSPILLLCGPPGTGKTSIARSLAESMGRKFYRISLGGIRDEAEIRGHRRTYVAALPGALAMALRNTGVRNPVILLDEIDKIGQASTHGDPAAALLEVLDPEQNWCFQDHYLGIPLDLSEVLFIATANSLETISEPLFDRMELVELSGYVHDEKLHIARQYLIPKQLSSNMLPSNLFKISDDVLMSLITSYTREAGVRTIERELGSVCRYKAVRYSEARDKLRDSVIDLKNKSSEETGEEKGKGWEDEEIVKRGYYDPEVKLEDLSTILGMEKYDAEEMDRENLVGVATGLSYMGSGNGGILHIESTTMPGSGGFTLTGQLGEVISESAMLAFAWVKSHAYELGISSSKSEDVFKDINIHIHLPSGSVRKDGPSAGVALVVAMVSLMRGIKVRKGVAMTGEITLRGHVTPVGGIKEKILGAHRAGIRTIVLPYKNEKDVLADLPASVKADMTFIFVRYVNEALEAAFGPQLWDFDGVEGGLRGRGHLIESHL